MNATSSKIPLTVIIPTRNEEKNIVDCLDSVKWADQIFVVDSQSKDATADIAQSMGAEVIQFHYNGRWPKKKNWAIRNLDIRHEWFLILDADERIEEELRVEIDQAIQADDVDGYYVRWKFFFLGRWMRHCWRHGWMLRLVRKGKGNYEDLGMRGEGGWDNEVHENIVVTGKTSKLKSWLTHDSKENLSQWIVKQNEFSNWNAKRRSQQLQEKMPSITGLFSCDPMEKRKFLKHAFLRIPLKPVFTFVYLYIFRFGFLDGKEGFYFCTLRACHELNTEAKMFEAQLK